MPIGVLAQSASQAVHNLPPEDKALIHLMLIGVVLAVGLLMVIGLLVAWRNYNQRQRELDLARAERQGDAPRPDAWATAAQRLESLDDDPDQAHVAHDDGPAEQPDQDFDDATEDDNEDEDDEDDFPFDLDDEDDDGPFDRA